MPLVLLFIVVPIVELYVIIQVGQWIGVVPTLAILLGDALLGSWLLRQQGVAAWRRFNAALDQRRFPGREVADGVMIVVGGTLLLTPGFITDIAGLLLLIPPSRAAIRRVMFGLIGRRFRLAGSAAGWGYERMRRGREPGYRPPPGPGPSQGARPYDVEGDAHEVSPEGGGQGQRRDDDGEPPPLPRP
jgi:UPF0716 protein FxsA